MPPEFKVWVTPIPPVKFTVPVPAVNVPVLDQLPLKVMLPKVSNKVPALVTSPATLRVPLFTLRLEPAGIVIPAAKASVKPAARKNSAAIRILKFLILRKFKPYYCRPRRFLKY